MLPSLTENEDFMKKTYPSLNIPKRHTLRHYMTVVGQLYGEPKETLDEYITEQVEASEDNLDGAIDCFKSLITPEHETKLRREKQAKELEDWPPFGKQKRKLDGKDGI